MQELVHSIFPYVTSIMLAIVRVLATMFLIPIFSFKTIRGLPRYAVAMAVSLPVSVTLVEPLQQANFHFFMLFFIMLKEAVIGFIIGFLMTLPFWMYQSIGAMIDNQRGALSGGYFNPGAGPDSSMLSDVLSRALGILLIAIGAFPALFNVILESYVLWPPLEWMPQIVDSAHEFVIASFQDMLYKFTLYAGPVILILLLIESGFAILGTYSPQLQVYFMAMPVKSIIGTLILVLYFDTLWYVGGEELIRYYDLLLELTNVFIPKSTT